MCPLPRPLPRLELTLATGWTELPKLTLQLPNASTQEQQPPPPPVMQEVLLSGTSVVESGGDANLDCNIFLSFLAFWQLVSLRLHLQTGLQAVPAELEFDISS